VLRRNVSNIISTDMKTVDLTQVIDLIDVADFGEGTEAHSYDLPDGTGVEFKTNIERMGGAAYFSGLIPYFDGFANVDVYDVYGFDEDGSVIPTSNLTAFVVLLERKLNE